MLNELQMMQVYIFKRKLPVMYNDGILIGSYLDNINVDLIHSFQFSYNLTLHQGKSHY